MKKLLVPCDFSKPAIHAFRFALDIAERSPHGIVHLLHVIELPVMHDSLLMPTLVFEKQLLEDMRKRAEREFEQMEKKYNKVSLKVVTEILFGKPADCIQQYSKEHVIDVIIMGSHGASGFKEFVIGSNAEKIIRNASVPVLVLKDYFKGPIKSIVFPNTLETEGQEELVQKVKVLQNFFNAHLHIVWVNTPLNFTPDSIARKRLRDFATRFQFTDYTINTYSHLNPEDGIIEFTRDIKGSLIAMGTHGRKGIAHLIHGSLTESLVNHTTELVWSYVMKDEPVESN